jgi:hypothetical protein
MTHPPGLRILMAKDAVAGIAIYSGALVPWFCVNATNVVAQQRRCALRRCALRRCALRRAAS